jgi:hypothetical protein
VSEPNALGTNTVPSLAQTHPIYEPIPPPRPPRDEFDRKRQAQRQKEEEKKKEKEKEKEEKDWRKSVRNMFGDKCAFHLFFYHSTCLW